MKSKDNSSARPRTKPYPDGCAVVVKALLAFRFGDLEVRAGRSSDAVACSLSLFLHGVDGVGRWLCLAVTRIAGEPGPGWGRPGRLRYVKPTKIETVCVFEWGRVPEPAAPRGLWQVCFFSSSSASVWGLCAANKKGGARRDLLF